MSFSRGNKHFSSDISQLEIETSVILPISEPEVDLKFVSIHYHKQIICIIRKLR